MEEDLTTKYQELVENYQDLIKEYQNLVKIIIEKQKKESKKKLNKEDK